MSSTPEWLVSEHSNSITEQSEHLLYETLVANSVTRARVTQIMKLLRLAPDIQSAILALPPGTPERLVTERKLWNLVDLGFEEQRVAVAGLLGEIARPGRSAKENAC